MTRRSKKV